MTATAAALEIFRLCPACKVWNRCPVEDGTPPIAHCPNCRHQWRCRPTHWERDEERRLAEARAAL